MNNTQLQELKKLLEREPYVLDWSREGIELLEFTSSPSTATLGEGNDGVTFHLNHYPTCYRRGQWRLLVEIHGGPGHHKWGCFDEQDQPLRNYHLKKSLLDEADAIARVLINDRFKEGETIPSGCLPFTKPSIPPGACCANESRNINGGCDNCGDPSL